MPLSARVASTSMPANAYDAALTRTVSYPVGRRVRLRRRGPHLRFRQYGRRRGPYLLLRPVTMRLAVRRASRRPSADGPADRGQPEQCDGADHRGEHDLSDQLRRTDPNPAPAGAATVRSPRFPTAPSRDTAPSVAPIALSSAEFGGPFRDRGGHRVRHGDGCGEQAQAGHDNHDRASLVEFIALQFGDLANLFATRRRGAPPRSGRRSTT